MTFQKSDQNTRFRLRLDDRQITLLEGNSYELPFFLDNLSDAELSLSLSLSGLPNEWISLPVPPVIRLRPGQSQLVSVNINLPDQTGALAGRYQGKLMVNDQGVPDQIQTEPIELTVFARQNQYRVDISLESQEGQLAPGGKIQLPVYLNNPGETEQYLEVSFLGIPGSWISVPNPVVQLEPGGKKTLPVLIEIPEAPRIQPGRYPIKIRAANQVDPTQAIEAEYVLNLAASLVQGRIGVMVESAQYAVAPGSSAEIQVAVQNHGVQADSFRLSIEGIPSNWISTASPVIQLEPGASKTVGLKIMPPRDPHSRAGRHTFAIQVASQSEPNLVAEIESSLSIAAYSDFAVSLTPSQTEPNTPIHLSIQNRGNVHQTFSATFQSLGDRLAFEPIQQTIGGAPVAWPASSGPLNSAETVTIQIPAGETTELVFRTRPFHPIWVGGTHTDNYRITVRSADRTSQSVEGLIVSQAVVPAWVLGVGISLCLVLGLFSLYLLYQGQRRTSLALETAQFANAATQTVIAEQTAVASLGGQDSDGDGLTTADELQRGTNPAQPDTDGDRLNDGEEVSLGTDPLNPDSDQDGLSDGDEVLIYRTSPINPDSDGDQLLDGDEVQRGLDPLNPDTDGDKLRDGDEILIGTDPLKQDTDGDRIIDGDEQLPCPDPLNPDTDGDGVIDGQDIDPCDPGNPSLTASAVVEIPPTETPVPATIAPTEVPGVTEPAPPAPQALPGLIAFESNREGNPQLYTSSDPAGGTANRLVSSVGVDTQPDWSPNGNRIAFTSNQDGNNEIYLLNADGSGLQRLTNDPANDQFPSWSPDGQWIAFTSDRDGNQEIYKIRVDGSELLNLSNNPANDYQPDWYDHPEFLGITEEILFTSDRDGNHEVYVMQVDGSQQLNLTNHPSNDSFPAGTSIGNRIAFSSDREGNQEIFVMDRNGENLVNLTGNPASEFGPVWSPDGLWVGYVSDRDGNMEIYVLSTLDGGQYNFSRNAAQDLYPAWK
jgi:uncharacterized membrane protein